MQKKTICALLLATFSVALRPSGADDSGCVVLDAALRYLGDLYLFSGDKYLEFIVFENDTDVITGTVDDWDGLPSDLNAAVQWTGDHQFYFFHGNDYYNYIPVWGLRGPWDVDYYWDPFFKNGIDAAGNRQGVSHFFKGCDYVTWASYSSGISDVQDFPSGIPCPVDAAWDLDNNYDVLVLAKGDQMWLWGENVTGPYSITSFYNISTWTLCS